MGNAVFVCEFPSGKKWLDGITLVNGPLSYHVELTDGQVIRRHVDHIRLHKSKGPNSDLVDKMITIPTPDLSPADTEAAPAAAPAEPH